MFRAIALGTLLLCGPATAFAAEPDTRTRLALELMEVSKAASAFEAMEPMLRQQMTDSLSSTLTCKSAQSTIEAVSRDFAAAFSESIDVEKLKVDLAAVYAELFDDAELQAMIDFHKTPAGQKMVAHMPELMQKMAMMTQSSMQDMFPRIDAIMKANEDQLLAARKSCEAEAKSAD